MQINSCVRVLYVLKFNKMQVCFKKFGKNIRNLFWTIIQGTN